MPININRKQWIIGSAILLIVIILGVFVVRNMIASRLSVENDGNIPVIELVYCNSSEVKPCIVSFSLDADNKMLVNLLLPDLSYPGFYLKITRGEYDILYECQRISFAPNNAYCIGEKLPPGEVLHLTLFSTKNNVILAEGSLSIIGLALPTLGVTDPTSVPTAGVADPTNVPTASTEIFVTIPPTQPSYPSYP